MPDPDAFDILLTRFAKLGRADRDAVLAALHPEERDAVLAAVAQQETVRRESAATARYAGRQYASYSPWLAAIVRAAVDGVSASDAMSERTGRAIVAAHGSAEVGRSAPADSLWSQVRRLIDGAPRPR